MGPFDMNERTLFGGFQKGCGLEAADMPLCLPPNVKAHPPQKVFGELGSPFAVTNDSPKHIASRMPFTHRLHTSPSASKCLLVAAGVGQIAVASLQEEFDMGDI